MQPSSSGSAGGEQGLADGVQVALAALIALAVVVTLAWIVLSAGAFRLSYLVAPRYPSAAVLLFTAGCVLAVLMLLWIMFAGGVLLHWGTWND